MRPVRFRRLVPPSFGSLCGPQWAENLWPLLSLALLGKSRRQGAVESLDMKPPGNLSYDSWW